MKCLITKLNRKNDETHLVKVVCLVKHVESHSPLNVTV